MIAIQADCHGKVPASGPRSHRDARAACSVLYRCPMAQHMYQYSLFHCYLTVVVYSTSPCRSTVLTSLYAPLPRRGYHGRAAAAAAAASTAPLPGTAWRATKAPQSRPQDAGGNRSGGMSVGRGSTPARVHLVPKYAVAAADAALAATTVTETPSTIVHTPHRAEPIPERRLGAGGCPAPTCCMFSSQLEKH